MIFHSSVSVYTTVHFSLTRKMPTYTNPMLNAATALSFSVMLQSFSHRRCNSSINTSVVCVDFVSHLILCVLSVSALLFSIMHSSCSLSHAPTIT